MIDPKYLKIESWPPGFSRGGQHVGTGPSGIKLTYIPGDIEACVNTTRSQHTNRLLAMEMIEAAITHPKYRGA